MGLLFEGKEYSKDEVVNLPINELIKICKSYNLTYAEFGPFLYKNRHVLWLKLEEKIKGQNDVTEEISFYNSIIKDEESEDNNTDESDKAINENAENIEATEIEEKEVEIEEPKSNETIDLSSWTNILEISNDSDDNTTREEENSDTEFKYSYSELQVLDYITLANLCVDAGLIASEEDDDYYSYTKFELIAMLNNKYQLYTNLESIEEGSEKEDEEEIESFEDELKVKEIKAVDLSKVEEAAEKDSNKMVANEAEAEEIEAEVEIDETENKVKAETEVEETETEVKSEIEENKAEVKSEIEESKAEVKAEVELEDDINKAEECVKEDKENKEEKIQEENNINKEEHMKADINNEEIQTQPYKMIKYMPGNKENKFLIVEAVIGDRPIYRQPTELEIEEIFNNISLYRNCNK